MADPAVPLVEKSQSRLEDDAIFLMLAGTDAPSQASAITLFHVLDNPEKYQRLRDELLVAIPDVTDIPSLEQLERVPYLVS